MPADLDHSQRRFDHEVLRDLRAFAGVSRMKVAVAVGSTEFLVLRRRGDSALGQATLLAFLRSSPIQTILKWSQDGSHHPRYDDDDLLAIPVPDTVCDASSAVAAHIEGALKLREDARDRLASARRAVELAIEGSDRAAMAQIGV